MKAVFFNAIGRTATRGSFAAQAPAELINRYLVFAFVRRTAKFESRRNRGASATDDCNLNGLLLGQIMYSHNRILETLTEPNETSNMRAITSTTICPPPAAARKNFW